MKAVMELFRANYRWDSPIRSLGVRVTDLMPDGQRIQLEFDVDKTKRKKLEKLDQTVDWLNHRYGSIQRATLLTDRDIS